MKQLLEERCDTIGHKQKAWCSQHDAGYPGDCKRETIKIQPMVFCRVLEMANKLEILKFFKSNRDKKAVIR